MMDASLLHTKMDGDSGTRLIVYRNKIVNKESHLDCSSCLRLEQQLARQASLSGNDLTGRLPPCSGDKQDLVVDTGLWTSIG